jgi:hypothetical protein
MHIFRNKHKLDINNFDNIKQVVDEHFSPLAVCAVMKYVQTTLKSFSEKKRWVCIIFNHCKYLFVIIIIDRYQVIIIERKQFIYIC